MKERSLQEFKELVQSRLNPREKVISIYQARSSKSVYACIVQDTYHYTFVRLSDHKSTSKSKADTVFTNHDDFWLKTSLSLSLYENAHWHVFDEESYIALLWMNQMIEKGCRFYAHQGLKGKIYLIFPHAKKEIVPKYYLSSRLQHSFKNLLKTGLMSLHSKKLIYPTKAAQEYLTLIKSEQTFDKYWRRFEKHINWEELENNSKLFKKKNYGSPRINLRYQTNLWSKPEASPIYHLRKEKKELKHLSKVLRKLLSFLRKEKREGYTLSLQPKIVQTTQKKSHDKINKDVKNKTLRNNEKESIKQAWQKNISHRSKGKISTLLSDNTLKELEELKNSLLD